jgi:hypothetical protein
MSSVHHCAKAGRTAGAEPSILQLRTDSRGRLSAGGLWRAGKKRNGFMEAQIAS